MADDADSDETYRTTFDTDDPRPNVDVTEVVSDLKGVDSDELAPLYDCIDHLIDNIFSDPPDPQADAKVVFTYEGYRIVVEQDGQVEFRRID